MQEEAEAARETERRREQAVGQLWRPFDVMGMFNTHFTRWPRVPQPVAPQPLPRASRAPALGHAAASLCVLPPASLSILKCPWVLRP